MTSLGDYVGMHEDDRIRAKNTEYNRDNVNYAICRTFSAAELEKLHKRDICTCFVEDGPHFKYCNKSSNK